MTIGNSGADLCLVALGAPKQELFADHGKSLLPNISFVCIGAGLDFIAGAQVRAPIGCRVGAWNGCGAHNHGCRTWHPCPCSAPSAATLRLFAAGAEALPRFREVRDSLTIDPKSANDRMFIKLVRSMLGMAF